MSKKIHFKDSVSVDQILESIEGLLETPEEVKEEASIAKSYDLEKRLFTAVVLRPNVEDAHGDIYDEDVVEKACHNYNEFCSQGNVQHLIQTPLVVPVESWIAKASHPLGEGAVISGDWLMTVRVDDDELWDMCKKGDFTGFSVGCSSLVEKLDEE